MSDGARTRGHRNHNPALYQLSYTHHTFKTTLTSVLSLRERTEFDRPAHHSSVDPSNTGTPERTRTSDPRLRRPLLCPAELQAQEALRGPPLLLPFCLGARAEYVVGAGRFELPTSCSQGRRANQAALRPAQTNYYRADSRDRSRNSQTRTMALPRWS